MSARSSLRLYIYCPALFFFWDGAFVVCRCVCVCVRESETEKRARRSQLRRPVLLSHRQPRSSLQWVKGRTDQVKPKAPSARRPHGERLQGGRGRVLKRRPFKKAGGLSPAAQWNLGIASASSESRASSPAGGEVCFNTKLSLAVDFFFSPLSASFSSFLSNLLV